MPCDPVVLRDLLNDRLAPVAVADVETHLESCPSCRSALDRLAGGESWASAVRDELVGTPGPVDRTPLSEEEDDPLDFLAPSEFDDSLGRVGPYEVKGILGRGGNGIVLKAFDAGLNRFVAVKVIASVLAGSAAARARFTREARAAAAVVHENVVAVHGVDQANGLPYLVMEYVKGRSAQDKLDRTGPLLVVEVLRIAHQTAAGLAAAHAQGLVHRDIKPANILLENGVERVKLTDFGLARAVTDACLTQSGVIAGTPYYMAPEQARGESVDHRADLFSLGSTLYALLAGRPPFRADTPLAVLRRVTDDTPRPLRELNPDVPDWLDRAIARLMAKTPDDRYQSAADVARVFERCLAHVQNPLAEPVPNVPRVRRPFKLRLPGSPAHWLACGLVGAAVAVGGWAANLSWPNDDVAFSFNMRRIADPDFSDGDVDPEDDEPDGKGKWQKLREATVKFRAIHPEEDFELELRRLRVELDKASLVPVAPRSADPVAGLLDGLRHLAIPQSMADEVLDPLTIGLANVTEQLKRLELELARDRGLSRLRIPAPPKGRSAIDTRKQTLILNFHTRGMS